MVFVAHGRMRPQRLKGTKNKAFVSSWHMIEWGDKGSKAPRIKSSCLVAHGRMGPQPLKGTKNKALVFVAYR